MKDNPERKIEVIELGEDGDTFVITDRCGRKRAMEEFYAHMWANADMDREECAGYEIARVMLTVTEGEEGDYYDWSKPGTTPAWLITLS